jgi:hypothetical protein
VSYKSSILCDVEFGLCLYESVVVFHPLRCELIVVMINAMVGMVEIVNTVMTYGARIC